MARRFIFLTGLVVVALLFNSISSQAFTQDAFRELTSKAYLSQNASGGVADGFYPTKSLPFEVRRVRINSGDSTPAFGESDLSYNAKCEEENSGNVVCSGDYLYPSIRVYRKTLTRGYINAPGVRTKLQINEDSSFTELELGSNTELNYDTSGLLKAIRDKNQNTISITRNASNQVSLVSDGSGRSIAFTYSSDFISKATFSAGGSIDYEYVATVDGTKITKITDLVGRIVTFSYNTNGRLETSSDPSLGDYQFTVDGNEVTLSDSGGALIARASIDTQTGQGSSTNSYGLQASRVKDFRGLLTGESNSIGRFEFKNYDADWNLVRRITNSDTISLGWGSRGELKSYSRSLGETRIYTYDSSNRLLEVVYVGGETEGFNYDTAGNITTRILRNGERNLYQYDGNGNKTRVEDADGFVSTFEFNNLNFIVRRAQCECAGGAVGIFEYDTYGYISLSGNGIDTVTVLRDAIGRELIRNLPGGGKVTTTWAPSGRSQVVKNGVAGETVTYEYSKGQLIAMTDATGAKTSFTHTATGTRSSSTNSLGALTSYGHDSSGLLNKVDWPSNPLGSPVRNYTFDSEGRVIEHIRETGDQLEYEYNSSGRLVKRKANGDVVAEYVYDSRGIILTSTDPLGTTTYTKDVFGRRTKMEFSNGASINWIYSKAGRVERISAGGHTSDIGYDSSGGRLGSVGTDAGDIDYTYDSAGRLAGMSYPNGVEAIFTFGSTGRMDRIEYRNVGNDTIIFDISRDSMGVITSTYRSDLNETAIIQYSDRNEIIGTEIASVSDTMSYLYQYDSAGNRILFSSNSGTTSYNYDPGNHLDSGGVDYTYNLAGEVTAIGARAITIDAEGRISQDSTPLGTVTYDYNAFGQRIRATINGTEEWRMWDATKNNIADADNLGNIIEFRYYVPGVMDGLLGFSRGDTTYFTLMDPAGNVAFVVDENANVVARYAYRPFSVRENDSFDSIDNRFRFAKRREEKSGGYYVRARSLDVGAGRFMQRDPLFMSNLSDPFSGHGFLYTNNDPVNKKDPTGLECEGNGNMKDDDIDLGYYEEVLSQVQVQDPVPACYELYEYGTQVMTLIMEETVTEDGDHCGWQLDSYSVEKTKDGFDTRQCEVDDNPNGLGDDSQATAGGDDGD